MTTDRRKIAVVMTTDNNYIMPTRVSVYSMLEASSDDSLYEVYILCSQFLSKQSREYLCELENYFFHLKVHFIEVDESLFEKAFVTSFYTLATYYRIVIPKVIDADKCIFLDGDTIVKMNLLPLYDADMGDNYLAGVRDCGMQSRISDFEEHRKRIGLESLEGYANAGVMLWNLKEMRTNHLYETFLQHLDKGYPSMDNDVLNVCCEGKITYLDIKYNFFCEFWEQTECLKGTGFTSEEIDSLKEEEMIFHFSGKYKPWTFLRTNASGIWWEMAKKALSNEEYQSIYSAAEELSKVTDWSYLTKQCKEQDDIIIMGYSEIAKELINLLMQSGINHVRCFCDNNADKIGLSYIGKEVLAVKDALEKYPRALWLVSSQNYYKEIQEQLSSLGIPEENIRWYFHKDKFYYHSIDNQYRLQEELEYKRMKNEI